MKKLYVSAFYSEKDAFSLLAAKCGGSGPNLLVALFFALIALAPFASLAQAQKVVSLTLVNADTEQDIKVLANGESIDLRTLPTSRVNIRAETEPAQVGSVVFRLDRKRIKTENRVPYTMFGDTVINNVINYYPGSLPPGQHIITATPYTGTYGLGTKGDSLAINITVTGHQVTGFTLINADNEQELGPIVEGTVIDLAVLPTQNLNIRANANSYLMGSVIFGLNNRRRAKIEHHPPYSLFGDTTLNKVVNYRGGALPIGGHRLVATPYSSTYGMGVKGDSLVVNFSVRNGTITGTPGEKLEQKQAVVLNAYPNPSANQTKVEFSVAKSGPVAVEMYDLKGAMVQRLFDGEAKGGEKYAVSVNTEKLNSGVYLFRLRTNAQTTTQRLIITK